MTEREKLTTQYNIVRQALETIVDRIKDHPAYAQLTAEEEEIEGGDTAEFSYLARLGDEALSSAKKL